MERPAEDQGQCDDADLEHVGALVESCQPCRTRERHAQFLPIPFMRESKLLKRGAQHVLENDEASGLRDDDALGADSAVSDISRILVQRCHRGQELAKEAQRCVYVERKTLQLGYRQKISQPDPGRVIGHQREGRRSSIAHSIDAQYTSEILLLEGSQAAQALAQREFKRGNRRQLVAQAQYFQRCGARWIDNATPLAETIVKHANLRREGRSHCWVHANLLLDEP